MQLQSDEDKDEPVEDEGESFPNRPRLQAHSRGEDVRALAAEIESAGDDGEDAGGVDGVRGQIGDVGCENAERDFDGAVVDAVLDSVNYCADDEADQKADGGEIG